MTTNTFSIILCYILLCVGSIKVQRSKSEPRYQLQIPTHDYESDVVHSNQKSNIVQSTRNFEDKHYEKSKIGNKLAKSLQLLQSEHTTENFEDDTIDHETETGTANHKEAQLLNDIIVICAADGSIYALNITNGNRIWKFETNSPLYSSDSAQDDNIVLIPSTDGSIYIHSAEGISKLPLSIQDLVLSSPFQAPDGTIYVGWKKTTTYTINPITGEVYSSFSATPGSNSLQKYNTKAAGSASKVALLFGRADYSIRALSPFGEEKWNISFSEFLNTGPDIFHYSSLPKRLRHIEVTVDGSVYATNENRNAFHWKTTFLSHKTAAVYSIGFDAKTGQAYLDLQLPVSPPHSSNTIASALSNNGIYIDVFGNQLFALPPNSYIHDKPKILRPESDKRIHQLLLGKGNNEEELAYSKINWHKNDPGTTKIQKQMEHSLQEKLSLCEPFSPHYPFCLVGVQPVMLEIRTDVGFHAPLGLPAPEHVPQKQLIILPKKPPNDQPKHNSSANISPPLRVNELPYKNYSFILLAMVIVGCFTSYAGYRFARNSPNNSDVSITSENATVPVKPLSKKKQKQQNKLKKAKALHAKSAIAMDKATTNDNVRSVTQPNVATEVTKKITKNGNLLIGQLEVTSNVLGYGSSGTIVFEGLLANRKVAVKRMLKAFYDIAHREVLTLLESDEHPNVVRYFTQEEDDEFIYLTLSWCPQTLERLVQKQVLDYKEKKRIIRELTVGVAFLHSLSIVHRDLKPQNVLMSQQDRVQISDMGLAKKLSHQQQSYSSQSAGSIGWQAPEMLEEGSTRQSNKVDTFALGCLIHYILSDGAHPFGKKFNREVNILKGKKQLHSKVKENPLAAHLIKKLLVPNPKKRLSAEDALLHPFFWSDHKCLLFLKDASDRLEVEPAAAEIVKAAEQKARQIFKHDWLPKIGEDFKAEIQGGKYRKYKGSLVRDLLRVIRNKSHHYRDLPDNIQHTLGAMPSGFLNYFNSRFPNLIMAIYDVLVVFCSNEPTFKQYFAIVHN